MPYTIKLADNATTLITIPDQTMVGPTQAHSSNCSLYLVGKNEVNYGLATATNFVWLLQNFQSTYAPPYPLAGQIWYNTGGVNPKLQLYTQNEQWVQIATSDAPFSFRGDIAITDTHSNSSTLGANGVITLVRTDYQPRIIFSGGNTSNVVSTSNAVTLQLGYDRYGIPDLTISTPSFSGNAAIWHSKNLSPFDLTSNSAINGFNTFTNTTTFNGAIHTNQIINAGVNANCVISNGSITLSDPSGHDVIFYYSYPDAYLNFSSPSGIFYTNGNLEVAGNSVVTAISGTDAVFSNSITLNGAPVITASQSRLKLNQPITLYVDAVDGNDFNNGFLVGNTIQGIIGNGAFQSLQRSWDFISNNLDLSGFNVTVQCLNGTYTSGLYCNFPVIPSGIVTYLGNSANPSACTISTINHNCIVASNNTLVNLGGFQVIASGTFAGQAVSGVTSTNQSQVNIIGNMTYGACSGSHLSASQYSQISVKQPYTILGGANTHFNVSNGFIGISCNSVTLSGNPVFGTFGYAKYNGIITISNSVTTFNGTAMGVRYLASTNAIIDTNNSGKAYFPGNSNGITSTNGIYI